MDDCQYRETHLRYGRGELPKSQRFGGVIACLAKDVRIDTLSVLPSLLAEIKAEITETLRTIEEGKRSRPSYNPK